METLSAEAIFHPVRMRILMTLTGRRLTTQQIGAALPEVAQATLYRHVSRLMKAGIITVVDRRPVRGVLEKVYALAGNGPVTPDVSGMNTEEWGRAFAAFTASLMGQFEVYIRQQDADPVADGFGFRTAPLYLSDAEMTQLRVDLRAVLVPLLSYGPSLERRRQLFSTVLIPDVEVLDADLEKADVEKTGELK